MRGFYQIADNLSHMHIPRIHYGKIACVGLAIIMLSFFGISIMYPEKNSANATDALTEASTTLSLSTSETTISIPANTVGDYYSNFSVKISTNNPHGYQLKTHSMHGELVNTEFEDVSIPAGSSGSNAYWNYKVDGATFIPSINDQLVANKDLVTVSDANPTEITHNMEIHIKSTENLVSGNYSDTLYFTAYANPAIYTLKYNSNLPSGISAAVSNMPTDQYPEGNLMTSHTFDISTNIPILGGFTFIGWCKDSATCANPITFTDTPTISTPYITPNINLYAQWEATGTALSIPLVEGANISVIRTSSPNGNGNIGALSNGDAIYYGDILTITASAQECFNVPMLTVTGQIATSGDSYTVGSESISIAVSDPTRKTFTITFDGNTSTSGTMASTTKVCGIDYVLPDSSFTKDNFTFAGWNTKADGTGDNYVVGGNLPINDNITLYAKWVRDVISVTFEKNATDATGTMTAQTLQSGVTDTLAANAYSLQYHDFTGWNTKADGSGTTYADKASVTLTANTTLYAQWSRRNATITFDKNNDGATGSTGNQIVQEGITTNLTQNGYSLQYHDFTGWNTKADGSGTSYTDKGSITATGNTTLYAQWSRKSATITFNKNNDSATGTMGSQTVGQNVATNLNQNAFSLAYHDFAGWNTQADGKGTSYADKASITVTENTTLYAQWTRKNSTIVFDKNASDATGTMSNQTLPMGLSGTLSTNGFSRTYFDFAGWNTNSDGSGTTYADGGFITPTTDTVNLYAKWTRQNVTITFNKNASDATGTMNNQTVGKAVSTALTANAFSRSGYDFNGWNTKADGTGTNYADKAAISITENTTLYAKWTGKSYTITWNANGGSVSPTSSTKTYNSTLGTLPTPTYDDYNFLGWFTSASGGSQISSTTTITGDVTYWAHWGVTFDQAFANAGKSKQGNYYKMQDMNGSICSSVTGPTTTTEDISTQLIDTRDNKVYWVNKLLDGNCWMTQNLDYDLSNSVYRSLNSSTSNVSSNTTVTPVSWGTGFGSVYFYEGGDKYLPNGSGSATNITCNSTANGGSNCHYHVGNFYSWTAATAGSGTTSVISADATSSICPKGWRLPTANSYTDNYSFGKLTNAYGTTNSANGSSDANLLKSPLWFVRPGYVLIGSLYDHGARGYVWSSRAYSNSNRAYFLLFYSSYVSQSDHDGRYYGFSVRCVAENTSVSMSAPVSPLGEDTIDLPENVLEVIRLINSLPKPEDVKLSDGELIERVRAAFEALTDEEKALINPELLKKYNSVLAAYYSLVDADSSNDKLIVAACAGAAIATTTLTVLLIVKKREDNDEE